MKLTDFTTLTFDVVGTLIDFERGMLDWLGPHFRRHVPEVTDDELLRAFAAAEDVLQQEKPHLPFTAMLPEIYDALAGRWSPPDGADAREAFRSSIAGWPPFPDSVEALAALKRHYRLVAVTNADNWALAAMSRTLGDPFDLTVTAEDVGLNKPSPKVFAYLLDKLAPLGVRKADILHTAQSQYHDIVPAKALGFATMWIKRRHGEAGWGATPPPKEQAEPDFLATSLADAVAQVRAAAQS